MEKGGGGQGCALVEPERGGPWRLTFAPGRLENLRFFIQIICWANHMLQVQSTVLPSIFLRAQPWRGGGVVKWAQCRPQVYQLNCCHIDVKYCCFSFTLLFFFKLHFLLHVLGTVFFINQCFSFQLLIIPKKYS